MAQDDQGEFLVGGDLAERIRTVCSADSVDCAVAFLGLGMRAELFNRSEQQVRIVCDLAMGSTSRAALKEFDAPGNERLRTRDWLHCKVYISELGIVIGSPNMSTNALGIMGRKPRTLEAGVFHSAGSKVWKTAKEWFEPLFHEATIVGPRELKRVPPYVRDPGPGYDSEDLKDLSLMQRLQRDPELFRDVTFVVTSEDLSLEEERRLIAAEPDGNLESVGRVEVIVLDEDRPRTKIGQLVIGFHSDDHGRQHVNGYVRCQASARADHLLAFGVDDWKSLDRQLRQPGLKKVCDQSRALVARIESDQVIFTAAEFAEALHSVQ